jgi:hypothetical protein
MKKLAVLFFVLITSLFLVSCQAVILTPTIEPLETEIDEQIATLELLLTQQAAKIESMNTVEAPTPTPVPMETEVITEITVIPLYGGVFTVIEMGGLVFKLPVEVAAGADVSTVLPDDPSEGWPEFALPARRMVSFSEYSIQEHFHTPVIYVFAIDKLIQGGQVGATTAAALQALLSDPGYNLQTEDNLPFLPPFNAGQVLHVLEQRLDSEHNSGIRYLTLYSQALMGVVNYDIFYTYQGISADGRYYIAAILPINSTLLSNEELTQAELETIAGDYAGYITSMKDLLIADNGASLTPTLGALDAMMMSIFSQD